MNTSNIIFKNEPKLSIHEVDTIANERRLKLVPEIKDFIENHPRFKDKEVEVTFSHEGTTSLVCIIEVLNEKSVLKISLRSKNNREALFLKKWEEVGVKVPHVIEDGAISEHSYILMEYIDAPIAGEVFKKNDLSEEGIYFKLGQILNLMHKPEAKGYGMPIDGEGEYEKFADFINGEFIGKQITYVKENNLLTEEHGSLEDSLKILIKHCEIENTSSYCHDDFGPSNAFYTDPITIFDPNPMFNNRYMDLGRSVIFRIALEGKFPEQFVAGYFDNQSYDKKVLHASLVINSYSKFPIWNKKKKLKNIHNVQNYLIQNKEFLE